MTDKNIRDYFNSLATKNSPAGEDMAMFLDSENSSGGFPLLRQVPLNSIIPAEKTNSIIVNENAIRNIGGKLYSNLTASINYIVSEGCSPSTPWSIMVEGDYNPEAEEVISLPRGCTIKGTITNVIGANVTIDPPYISVISENPTSVLLTTGLTAITFRGKLSISYKGLDPASGDTYPYMTGMSLSLVTFSPTEISGAGVTTMLLNSSYSNILRGDYSGFVYNRHLFSNIASIDGDIIIDGFQLFNSQVLGSTNISPTYGITFLNTGTSGITYFASNCYFQMFKPASGQTKIIDGGGQFWSCSMELAWDGIKARSLSFKNCTIYGSKEIGGVGDNNTLQIYSGSFMIIIGGTLSVNDNGRIELLAEAGESAFLQINGVASPDGMEHIDVYKTGSGSADITMNSILAPFLDIDASVDNVIRYGCLWDDATDSDESNFYSAKKIHDLLL